MDVLRSNGRRSFNWEFRNWNFTLSRFGFVWVGPLLSQRGGILFPRPNPERRIFKAMHGRKTP